MRARVVPAGLRADTIDVLVPFEDATDVSDAVVADGSVTGRSGYRAATDAALAGSGLAQGIARHRYSITTGHVVAGVGGTVYRIPDPASETATATPASLGAKFGATAELSAAQLNDYLYLASDDESGVTYPMQRVGPGLTIESVKQLEQGAIPTDGGLSTQSVSKFSAGTVTRTKSSASITESDRTEGSEHYYDYHRSGYNLEAGDWVNVQLLNTGDAYTDWTPYSHVILVFSPPAFAKGGAEVEITLGDNSGTTVWAHLATIHDSTDYDPNGSSAVSYLDLSGIPPAVLSTTKHMRFTMKAAGLLLIYGYVLVKASPGQGDIQYRTTFYDSGTGQESVPTPVLTKNIPAPVQATFATSLIIQRRGDNGRWPATVSLDPATLPQEYNGNLKSGMPLPSRVVYAGAPTITQAIPSSLQSIGTLRLWRNCENGWRLVDTASWSDTTTTKSIVDDEGTKVLSNEKWKATGTQSRCTAMAARLGRLVLGYKNRLYISSFTPPDKTGLALYPQFPAIAEDPEDGWAFDITPSYTEKIMALCDGDALYVATNEAVYAMNDLSPNSPVAVVYRCGVVGRRACVFTEDGFLWASHTGLYFAQGRENAGTGGRPIVELSEAIRLKWRSWLTPTSATVVAKWGRAVYVFVGTRYMSFSFETKRWSAGTLAHSVVHAAAWVDPDSAIDTLWLLTSDRKLQRWQASATTDDGTAVPDWTYSTGYQRFAEKARLGTIIGDVSGDVTVTAWKSEATLAPSRVQSLTAKTDETEQELPMPSDVASYKWRVAISGARGTVLRYLDLEFQPTEGRGG